MLESSGLAHELRTPLNAILSLSRILLDGLDGKLGDEQRKQVMLIHRSAEELCSLVDDLLDLSRLEAGRMRVRPGLLRVSALLARLRELLPPMIPKDSDLRLVFEEPTMTAPIVTDEGKLGQILRNLIVNAIKFTESGEIRVRAFTGRDGPVFEVRDTGIGIAPADQERIFEEFIQLETPIHARWKGAGLGLPLSRRLTELLGGRIEVESAVGVGSTFRVVLPPS